MFSIPYPVAHRNGFSLGYQTSQGIPELFEMKNFSRLLEYKIYSIMPDIHAGIPRGLLEAECYGHLTSPIDGRGNGIPRRLDLHTKSAEVESRVERLSIAESSTEYQGAINYCKNPTHSLSSTLES